MQGTVGYIGYFGSQEGKRTWYNCDYYERFAQCCFKDKKIQTCKISARCKYHTENTPVTILEIEKQKKKQNKVKVEVTKTRKKQTKKEQYNWK